MMAHAGIFGKEHVPLHTSVPNEIWESCMMCVIEHQYDMRYRIACLPPAVCLPAMHAGSFMMILDLIEGGADQFAKN